jgi:hypothetical protein
MEHMPQDAHTLTHDHVRSEAHALVDQISERALQAVVQLMRCFAEQQRRT